MKKTFLHICLSESWGGLEMAVSKWNEILILHNHPNINICTPGSPLAKDLQSKGFVVLEWNNSNYFSPKFTYKLKRFLRDHSINAVILQNLRDLWLVAPALFRKKEIKLIGFCQMLVGVKKKDLLHRLIYKRMDHLCVLTDWQKEALLPYLPVNDHKYCTIPNFVDCELYNPNNKSEIFRNQIGVKENEYVIGIIGRLATGKGQKELIEAFAQVIKKFTSCRLIIVGEPTLGEKVQKEYAASLRKMVSDLNLEYHVSFLGFRNDGHLLMANFDLYVLASHRETFGYVVVEAMASGTPIVATKAGGVPEILLNGELGYLCEPKNPKDLALKIEEAIINSEQRTEKARKALIHVRATYEKNRVYEKLIKMIS